VVGGGVWSVLHLIRKKNREEAAEHQIYSAYKELLAELQRSSKRNTAEIDRLTEMVRKQTTVLVEQQQNILKLREDRNKMSQVLADIKRVQAGMLHRGTLQEPLADIPTNIFPHSGGR